MNEQKILESLIAMLNDLSPTVSVSAADKDTDLQALGFDSLDVSGLLLKIEESYKVKISDEDAETLKTLADYGRYVGRLSAS